MKIQHSLSAIKTWLCLAFIISTLAGVALRAYADGHKIKHEGEKGLGGGYVDDPAAVVPAGSYVTFSTVYNGKRYYLGVDTIQARSGKDTVYAYEQPCYAAMWVVGRNWSETGAIRPDKNYSRTVKSVWLAERDGVERERFLSKGPSAAGYSPLQLLAESNATKWYTEKDDRERNKYIQGFLYCISDEMGVEVNRYLAYDPVYGFGHLYGAKPAASQRVSVWDRHTGSDLIYHMTPTTISFGYDVTHDTVMQPITSQVIYYEDVDRFRSRYNHADVFARQSTPITNQTTLINPPYNLVGHFEWKSNPADEAHLDLYDGHSKMKYYTITGYDTTDPENPVAIWGWADTTMVWARKDGFRLRDNVWYDTIYAIGKSPIDRPTARFLRKPAGGGAPTEGDYLNHSDVLYTHFTCHGQDYRDSVNVNRQIFHRDSYTTMHTAAEPNNWVFNYSKVGDNPADTAKTFIISGDYESGHVVRSVSGNEVDKYIGESGSVNIAGLPCHRDTIWTDAEPPTIDHIDLYDTLRVEALNIDGTPCEWVVATYLPARNQIRVKIAPYNEDATSNRTAQIRYTYSYWHSSAKGDNVTDSRVIWITQKWKGADNAELYAFHHNGELDAKGLQAVHEKKNIIYAIPEEPLNLPLHRDHWGYYRWFNYDGADHDKDPNYNSLWAYSVVPKNVRNTEFMPINHTTDASSRGRWDVIRDTEHPSNPQFAQDHFTKWTRTAVPAVNYPQSSTKSGKIACDVSDYYNITATGTTGVGVDLTSLTEPTLSYRQIFDIQPAKTRADQLAGVRGDGTGANWLENYTIVAPAGRAFSIQPNCPIAYRGSEEIDEEHLQYIYYFRPDPTGTVDPNMGADPGSNYDKAATYARVGKKYKAGSTLRQAKLLTASEVLAMDIDSTKKVFLVNPRRNGGYILGGNASDDKIYKQDILNSRTDTADLRHHIEDDILNAGGSYASYQLELKKTGNGVYTLRNPYNEEYLYAHKGAFGIGAGVDWGESGWQANNKDIHIDAYSSTSSSRITNIDPALVKMAMSASIIWDYSGILTAWTSDRRWSWNPWSYDEADLNLLNEGDDRAVESINQGWCFYEIIDPVVPDHFETPRWEKSTNGTTWTQVAHWDYSAGEEGKGEGISDAPGYSMTADGALHIEAGVHTTVNAPILYRLRTEHFQIANFQGQTRSADTEMLKLGGDIITEEEIERDYDIIYSLDMEHWPAPGTSDVVAYNQPFPWDFTELSYHYPLSVIPADRRVDGTEMPGKGEYAFINKFIAPSGPTTENPGEVFECMAGAEHGYMLCVNAAGKRATIMNFDFNQLTCSGQQIYLVGNYCNPVDNSYEPEITADMEGSNDGTNWTRIYRYKSGKIPYVSSSENHWHQMALPIARERIEEYKYFRCRAEISGGSQQNAHLLIDRLRFIEKDRAFSVFQNKANCVREDSVVALIRINYQAAPELYQPGKLVAYQFQMWKDTANGGAGGYVPMLASKSDGAGGYIALDTINEPKLQVFPGYVKDGFTAKESVEKPFLKSLKGYDYGYVLIPESDYDPSASDAPAGQSALRGALIDQALTKLGITGEAAALRKAQFLDETGNVRPFEEVIAHDYNDWGTIEFGEIKTAHIKSFVKVDDTWLLYIVCRLPVTQTDNNTFRVGVTVMNTLDDKPTFADDNCATFRILKVKQTTSLLLDGEAWPNYSREEIEADPDDDKTLLPANETYRASIKLTVKDLVGIYPTTNPRCKFDLLHAADSVRPNTAAGNLAFLRRYGCTRDQFIDDMEAFRIDDERNVMRDITDWNLVTPEMFTYTGRTPQVATEIYNRLNHLIRDLHVLELGLDYRDIYMGDKADSWFYLLPIPATGLFDVNRSASSLPDTTMNASVCNDTLWLQLHSEDPTAKLRFGYDSRVGDTYVVPVIRASKSQANGEDGKRLTIRIAESWCDPTHTVVIGKDSTELIGSNDPAWTGMQTFKYHQHKDMDDHKPNEYTYYAKGDTMQLTPAAGNNIALKAGYWYQFRTAFFAALNTDTYTADPERATGHTQFILAIAPDTVRWTPEHAGKANYWNDDHNWTPVMYNAPADFIATVPMGDTKVIIPGVAEGLLPIASEVVEFQKDTLHYGYAKNTCKEILFKQNAQILGQEKLDYKKAFVDVQFTTGNWQTFSPALEHIYSGDLYIPSDLSTDKDFLPGTFPAGSGFSGSKNPRVWPYAFYQGFYNSAVRVAFQNSDEEGNPVAYTTQRSKNTVDWVRSNALDVPYVPGAACVINSYDESDEDGNQIVVRLPKQEASYYGFGKKGSTYVATNEAIPMQDGGTPRPAFNALVHNLAYDSTALLTAGGEGITYTLTNEIASEIFFFGNPTMSLIDVYTLCKDNAAVLQHEDGTHHFTAYQLINGSSYTVRNITGPGQYFVSPQRAVGLIASSAQNELNIVLKPSALVAVTGEGIIVGSPSIKSGAPKRYARQEETENEDLRQLFITASNETDDGVKKAYLVLGEKENAQRGFLKGEDALCLSSGLNYFNYGAFSTPLSMYTIADNQALMMDIRDTLSNVPLVFSMLNEKYDFSDYTILAFSFNGEWSEPLYLHDALYGDSIMISDGLRIAVRTPLNDQIRYYINAHRAPKATEDTNIATGIDNNGGLINGDASLNDGRTIIYDLLGRRVMMLGENDLITNVQLPTGVYIIQRGNKTERMVIR